MLSLGGPGGRLREVEFAADAPVILRNSCKIPSTISDVRMFSQTGHTDTWNARCKDLTLISLCRNTSYLVVNSIARK